MFICIYWSYRVYYHFYINLLIPHYLKLINNETFFVLKSSPSDRVWTLGSYY